MCFVPIWDEFGSLGHVNNKLSKSNYVLLRHVSRTSLETETLLAATFIKIFAWSQADVCDSDHRLIVMNKDKPYELAV